MALICPRSIHMILLLQIMCIVVTGCQPAIANITPRRALAATELNGSVYMTGGWNGEATQLNLVETYDGNTVRLAPPMQIARSQHSAISADGKVWVMGGWRANGGLVSEIEVFDLTLRQWQIVGRIPTPRREPAAAKLGRSIVVAGGFNGIHDGDLDGYSDVVEAFDLDTRQWRTLARLNIPRRGLSMVTIAEQLYVIGGYNPADSDAAGFLSTIERYDAAQDRWQTLPWRIAARTWLAAEAFEGDLIIAGGYDRTGPLALVERIHLQTGKVCHPMPLAIPRAWLALATLNRKITAIGGETTSGFATQLENVSTTCLMVNG